MCNGSAYDEGKPHIVDNAGRKALPFNTESFESILARYVYVDKTLLARDLVERGGVVLFCRPRRFGKSTALRMLQCFFETPVQSRIPNRRQLFSNLAVSQADEYVTRECGAHPVIYLNLGGCGQRTYARTIAKLAQQVGAEYSRHRYLLSSDDLFDFERERFLRLAASRADEDELMQSIAWLSTLLCDYHQSQTVILIDEYDTPINDGYLNGYREEIVTFYQGWLTDALKGTTSLYLSVLTGVLRVSQESIFSELNNVTVNTTLDDDFEEAFGFTDDEADALALYTGHAYAVNRMRRWYDGYRFGNARIYNPWSVIHFLHKAVAQPYWTNTSSNGIVRDLIGHADEQTTLDLAAVASGGTVTKPLDLQTVFDDLRRNPQAVWAQMYQAGYLTTEDVMLPNNGKLPRALRIPNLEVRELFVGELQDRALITAGSQRKLAKLHQALVAGDADGASTALRGIMLDSPCYHDIADEGRCHMLLLALMYGMDGYKPPTSNRESGDGRSDVLVEPQPESAEVLPAIAIEIKRPKDDKGKPLEGTALSSCAKNVALAQAMRLEYGRGLSGNGLLRWGIAFGGKHVACAVERVS